MTFLHSPMQEIVLSLVMYLQYFLFNNYKAYKYKISTLYSSITDLEMLKVPCIVIIVVIFITCKKCSGTSISYINLPQLRVLNMTL